MKKNFFYMALAACVAMCNISCGDDDDTKDEQPQNNQVTLTAATFSNEACDYAIPEAAAASVTVSNEAAPQLTNISFTEDGKMIFELTYSDGSIKYVMYDVTFKDGVYTLANGAGTVNVNGTKAESSVNLTFSISIEVPGIGKVTYSTTENPIPAVKKANEMTGGAVMDYLARTWEIKSIYLELEGSETFTKEFTNGSLREVRDRAIKEGLSISDKEFKELDKEVKHVIVTKNGRISIVYTDGGIDAADWQWVSNKYDQFKIKLRDEEMQNKFFVDDTAISVAFKDDRCNMKLATNIKDSKYSKIYLTLRLQAAK